MSNKIKVKMEMGKILDFYAECKMIEQKDQPLSQRFSYALSLNQDEAERHAKAFEKMDRKDKLIKEYRKVVHELNIDMARKDEDGEPVEKDGRFVMKSQPEFDLAIMDLQEKHPAFEKREAFLEEKHDIEFFGVKSRHVPPFIELRAMRLFRPFIVDEPEAFTCPACQEKLVMEDNKLKALKEEKPEDTKLERRKAKKKARRDTLEEED